MEQHEQKVEDSLDDLERSQDDMEQRSERVGEHIDQARRDWNAKVEDSSVPTAEPRQDEPDQDDGEPVDEAGQ